ncbi:hypothetical protein [Pedobacter sp.]
MKTSFLIRSITLFIVALSFADNVWSQGSLIKFGFFGGVSNPTSAYRDSLSRARNGYVMGLSGSYFFPGSGLGIGIDARFARNPHQTPDPVTEQDATSTSTLSNTYHSPLRFKYYTVALGPVYRLGEGRLGLELYAKAGMIFEQFPTYTRKQTVVIQNQTGGGPFGGGPTNPVTFVFDQSAAKTERTNAWTALMGAKASYEITSGFEIFAFGDYQTTLGKKGRFTVEDLRSGQQPPQAIPITMISFGGGIRLSFGSGYESGALRLNP